MEKTLPIGDYVLVDRVSLAPARTLGALVPLPAKCGVATSSSSSSPTPRLPDLYLVKRCIGLPGDRILPRAQHRLTSTNESRRMDYQRRDAPAMTAIPKTSTSPTATTSPPSLQGIEEAANSTTDRRTLGRGTPSRIVNGELVVRPVPSSPWATAVDQIARRHSYRASYLARTSSASPMFVYWSLRNSRRPDRQSRPR